PIGLIWDSTHHSCGYDALLAPLGEIWRDNPAWWTLKLRECSPYLGLWALTMSQSAIGEHARDAVRRLLTFQNPVNFPTGPNPIMLDNLFMGMTDRRSHARGVNSCLSCGYINPGGGVETLSQYITVSIPRATAHLYAAGVTIRDWFAYHMDKPSGRCPCCSTPENVVQLPPLLLVAICSPEIILNDLITFKSQTSQKTLRLRGLLYYKDRHFTSIIIDRSGLMWYHDGIATGRSCRRLGYYRDVVDLLGLHRYNDERLSAAMYAEDSPGQ
ncbi:hypothetical protein DFH06DRAFT_1020012, partial [Mycena polygramma]